MVSTGAETIYAAITDVLLRLNLAISKVPDKCYNGTATMSGAKSGVATRLCSPEPRALFTHCFLPIAKRFVLNNIHMIAVSYV